MRTGFAAGSPVRAVLWGTVLLGAVGAPLFGQGAADEILRCIEESAISIRGACEDTPAVEWSHVINAPETYPDEYDALVPGLERFGSAHSSLRVRTFAIYVLTQAGMRSGPRSRAATVALTNVFDALQDDVARRAIVQRMRYQTDKPVVLAFLERAAQTEIRNNPEYSPAAESVYILSEMGAEGRTVLARLHSSRTIRDPGVRLRLDELAKTGFRRPR